MTSDFTRKRRLSPLIFIVLTVFIEVTGGGLLFPLIPYLVEEFRSDALTIGLLSSSFAMAQFLSAPVLGALSDRVGRRPVLLVCTFGTAIAFFVFGFAQALWVMFLAQIINGFTGGVISTAQAYIADVSASADERTKNFGLIGAAAGIGFIVGPALGGTLSPISLRLPVFIAGAIALSNVILGYLTMEESLKERVETPLTVQSFSPVAQLLNLIRRSELRYLLASYLLFYVAFGGLSGVFVVFARDRFSWGPSQVAGIFFLVGIISTIVQGGLLRVILPRFGSTRLLIAGLSAIAVAFIGICLAPQGEYLYATQSLFALGVGITSPTLRGAIANAVPDSEQGKVSGGSQSLVSLSQIMGPIIATGVYDRFSSTASFGLQATLVTCALLLILSKGE